MKRAYQDPLRPYVPNRWGEIKKARRGANRLIFRAWLWAFAQGLGTGLLVLGTTLLIFGWMPWWKEIHQWLTRG